MITQDRFVDERRPDWDELEALLDRKRALHRLPPESIARAAALYRAVCADVARAHSAGYGREVVGLLDALAARGHNALYSPPPYRLRAVWELVSADFPATLRRHGRVCALAAALFVLPGVLGYAGALASRGFAVRLLPASMAEQMEKAYAEGFSKGRAEGVDAMMAGFYVYNNVGIAFRCFATGVLFGLGSGFFLVYNGLIIGAVGGLVGAAGHGGNLLTFVCGHAPLELTAIVISGAAGMVMGYALVATDGLTRWASLRRRARDVATLVLGAAVLLLAAAAVEAFWSPSGFGAPIKWAVGATNAVLVAFYFALAGRGRRAPA